VKMEGIEKAVGTLSESDRQRQKREAVWSRWSIPVVTTLLGSAIMSLSAVAILLLQTFALQG
jgi:hypothetical protein